MTEIRKCMDSFGARDANKLRWIYIGVVIDIDKNGSTQSHETDRLRFKQVLSA